MNTLKRRRTLLGSAAAAAAAIVIGACAPEAPPASTTTTVPTSTIATVTDARLDWTISAENNNASYAPGQVNYWNATKTAALAEADYVATDGDVTVVKKNAAGDYVNIGSEASVSFANRNRNGAGNLVSPPTGPNFLGQKLVLTGGEGTVDTATGEASIDWTGSVTINFYGIYVPFSLTDFNLTVDAAGNGKLSATASGMAKDMADPDAPGVELPETNVVVADLPNVYGSGTKATGFTNAPTAYLGTAVTVTGDATPQSPKNASNEAFWGSWPQSFVDFQVATNLSSYWYTSGGGVDRFKAQDPVSVAYNLAP